MNVNVKSVSVHIESLTTEENEIIRVLIKCMTQLEISLKIAIQATRMQTSRGILGTIDMSAMTVGTRDARTIVVIDREDKIMRDQQTLDVKMKNLAIKMSAWSSSVLSSSV